MEYFAESTRRWFEQSFDSPTEAQLRGWPLIASGAHVLITAPTGSGKTLAAFLWSIDRLMRSELPSATGPGGGPISGPARGVKTLYVSPLKALVYDIERNLRAPLAGIARCVDPGAAACHLPRVGIRTGDTSQLERAKQLKEPPEILVTTPESLYLMLGSKAAENLRTVEVVIVDEVHALAPTKRGAHLALSLERLAAGCAADPQRLGLSATFRPLEEAAAFLGGSRRVEIVDVSCPPRLELSVTVPVPDMERPPLSGASPDSGSILGELYRQVSPQQQAERGMWSAIYPALLAEIMAHRSTIVFVNSRGLCERLCQRLNDLAESAGFGGDLARAHHGSVSHDKRVEIEDGLKRGAIKAIVATSSLEMGIDMGAVDQVLLVESPGAVSRGLQRVGRAGHGVGELSLGRIYPKFRGDLLECAVLSGQMLRGEIEAIRMPRNALDVLAQQVVAMCSAGERTVDAIHGLACRTGPYADLPRSALEAVLGMLSGHYTAGGFADTKPLLSWDRAEDTLSARKGAAVIARLNGGTIPDRGNYGVHLGGEGPRLGELDEEMVFETKAGDCILLGASTWRVEEITRDRVIVSPAPGEPGRLPFWRGDGPGRPLELGLAVGTFCRRLARLRSNEALDWVRSQAPLDGLAASNLVDYIEKQRQATGQVPSDRVVVIERFRDELGDWRVCILTPFGARIHAPWAMAIQWQLERSEGFEAQVMYTDDGIVLRFADGDDLPASTDLLPPLEDLKERVTEQLANTALFASLFRENAARALLMPRRSAKGRQPLWAQRLRAQSLLAAVKRFPTFPIVLETYRQALSDVFDVAGFERVLRGIESRSIRVHEVETPSASPFARSLVFAYVAAYIYEQDAPIAERRAQALTLDRGLLSELLGQAELRELIDPGVLENLEQELQHLSDTLKARDSDALHDLLRRLGDLTAEELQARCAADPLTWLDALHAQRRAVLVRIAGEQRWIASEDAGLYRDAVGIVPPAGLPDACLALLSNALELLLRRLAQTRGPFTTRHVAERYGLRLEQVDPVLQLLEARGELIRGEIRPFGCGPEWCDPEVLRRIRRRTLAKARNAVAPVDPSALGRFLPAWQGVGQRRSGPEALLEALPPLEGLTVPWSLLNGSLLPARMESYRPELLDMLAATGQIVWVGRAALGAHDGRVALFRRESIGALLDPGVRAIHAEEDPVDGDRAQACVLQHLQERGASFLIELVGALERAGLNGRDVIEPAIWGLVWRGLITNDTFAPLRSLAQSTSSRRRGKAAALAGGRWSLVTELLSDSSDTEVLVARARMLLERYGVVSREAVQAEALAGGFSPYYQVLKRMEEKGAVRRGYFIEGLSGAQFALSAAIERLRGFRSDEVPIDGYGADDVCVLAAADPANPFGALAPWPATGGQASPKRSLGAHVVLVAGSPALFLGTGGHQLMTFPETLSAVARSLDLAVDALHFLRVGRRVRVRTIDGVPVTDSPMAAPLVGLGFRLDYDTLLLDPAGIQR